MMTSEQPVNNNTIWKIALNLTGACLISGMIIALVYFLTDDIAVQKQAELNKLSLQSLVAEADEYVPIEGKPGWYIASKEGQEIAYVVPGEGKGYGGTIKMIVAVGMDEKVLKYTILESKETPGLGDKAAEGPFSGQFAGKGDAGLQVTKDSRNQEAIQAISGATITSEAVTGAVKNALDEVSKFRKGEN